MFQISTLLIRQMRKITEQLSLPWTRLHCLCQEITICKTSATIYSGKKIVILCMDMAVYLGSKNKCKKIRFYFHKRILQTVGMFIQVYPKEVSSLGVTLAHV